MADRGSHLETDEGLVAALDRLAFSAVGVTARSLVATSAAADLTFTQWRILALLHRADRSLRLGEVADGVGMSPPSASRLIDRLARRGLVRSDPDHQDRRARCIDLTPPGSALVRAVLASRRTLISDAVATLVDELPKATASAVTRLADALDASAGDVVKPMELDETLGVHGRIEVHDAGPAGPVRYTILFPEACRVSASPACGLIETIQVPSVEGVEPVEPSWGLAAAGESFGRRVRFDRLPPSVQARVRAMAGADQAHPYADGVSPPRSDRHRRPGRPR